MDQLRPTDSVAIVVYGTNARAVLDMTPVSEKRTILNAINRLVAEGSTNAGAGLWPVSYTHLDVYKRQGHATSVTLLVDAASTQGQKWRRARRPRSVP